MTPVCHVQNFENSNVAREQNAVVGHGSLEYLFVRVRVQTGPPHRNYIVTRRAEHTYDAAPLGVLVQ